MKEGLIILGDASFRQNLGIFEKVLKNFEQGKCCKFPNKCNIQASIFSTRKQKHFLFSKMRFGTKLEGKNIPLVSGCLVQLLLQISPS